MVPLYTMASDLLKTSWPFPFHHPLCFLPSGEFSSTRQIYLVDPSDAKALATRIVGSGRFKGIFGTEEVYEHVERRADWYSIQGCVGLDVYWVILQHTCILGA